MPHYLLWKLTQRVLGGIIIDIPAVAWTHMHIQNLQELRSNPPYECSCREAAMMNCQSILLYLVTQKTKKRLRRAVGAIPVVGTAETVRGKVKGIYKKVQGTSGSKRELYAHTLHLKARECLLAKAIVAELFGGYKRQASWEYMFAVENWDEGWKAINDKMAST